MSCNYADGLSPYHDKGQLGLEEKFDTKSAVSSKVSLLTKWINEANHVVIHTGAGISTSAGIPDFRGPRGVWTLQAKGEKPDLSKDFNEAVPTVTHMAIMKLVEKQKVKYVVSQNIDGLHLRSNIQRKYLSELHGNMFTEQCNSCNRQFVRSSPVPTVGQKCLNKSCPATKGNGRPCRGRLHDTILDWEHNLPENDLGMADYHSCMADLSICLGTTMQIVPSGNLPLYTKRHGGKLVIVNLQPTKHDKKANLIIHAYVDEVMTMLMKNLGIKIPKYLSKNDPTRIVASCPDKLFEWTISDSALKKMKKIYEEKCGSKEARKRLEMIYDDIPLDAIKNMKRKIRDEEDSDLEVLDVIVKPKRGRESSRKGSKKSNQQAYNSTITIKKVSTPPSKKVKYDGEKITIKKNVTPTKTKYEIVTKPKAKTAKCEIVYFDEGNFCDDLDMICESDDDETTNNFTYNFKMYLDTDEKKIETGQDIKDEVKDPSILTADLPKPKPETEETTKEKRENIKGDAAKTKEENEEREGGEEVRGEEEEEDDCGEIPAEIESVMLVENSQEDIEEMVTEKSLQFQSMENTTPKIEDKDTEKEEKTENEQTFDDRQVERKEETETSEKSEIIEEEENKSTVKEETSQCAQVEGIIHEGNVSLMTDDNLEDKSDASKELNEPKTESEKPEIEEEKKTNEINEMETEPGANEQEKDDLEENSILNVLPEEKNLAESEIISDKKEEARGDNDGQNSTQIFFASSIDSSASNQSVE